MEHVCRHVQIHVGKHVYGHVYRHALGMCSIALESPRRGGHCEFQYVGPAQQTCHRPCRYRAVDVSPSAICEIASQIRSFCISSSAIADLNLGACVRACGACLRAHTCGPASVWAGGPKRVRAACAPSCISICVRARAGGRARVGPCQPELAVLGLELELTEPAVLLVGQRARVAAALRGLVRRRRLERRQLRRRRQRRQQVRVGPSAVLSFCLRGRSMPTAATNRRRPDERRVVGHRHIGAGPRRSPSVRSRSRRNEISARPRSRALCAACGRRASGLRVRARSPCSSRTSSWRGRPAISANTTSVPTLLQCQHCPGANTTSVPTLPRCKHSFGATTSSVPALLRCQHCFHFWSRRASTSASAGLRSERALDRP